jgi:hypothetical protein
VSAIFALLIVTAVTIILTTSNLALAVWKAGFQQEPQIATQSPSPSSTAAIMAFNKIGPSSSPSSIYTSPSTAKDPYQHISSNNINPLQQFGTIRDESPLASRTNTNNVDASTHTTTTTGNTGSTPSSQVTMVTLSLGGQITCHPTELLRNSKCSPQPPTCEPIGISQDSKCNTRPLYYHHMLESIRSFRHH